MKKLLALFLITSSLSAVSQIHINDTQNYSLNLNNTAILDVVPDVAQNNSQGVYEEEFIVDLHIHNTSNDTLELKVRTSELNICANSKNTTCWVLCPDPSDAGTQPIQMSMFSEIIPPGDSIDNFAAHFYTYDTVCCARYLYEWVDVNNNNEVVAWIHIRYDATHTGSCSVGVGEHEMLDFSMAPNPAKDVLIIGNLNAKNAQSKGVNIYNSMGEFVRNVSLNTMGDQEEIDVSDLSNGLYHLAVVFDDQVVGSEKLIIQE